MPQTSINGYENSPEFHAEKPEEQGKKMPKDPAASGQSGRANAPRAAKSGNGHASFFPALLEGSYVCFSANGSPQVDYRGQECELLGILVLP